jgi:hypothetical protein
LNRKGQPEPDSRRILDPLLVESLWKQVPRDHEEIEVWTEVECKTENGLLQRFRADPWYDVSGAWYDWVMARFEYQDRTISDDESETETSIPCKLLCFYKQLDGTEMALAHCCGWESHQDKVIDDSNLVQHWKLQYTTTGKPILTAFELAVIDEGILVLEKNPTPSGIPKIINRKETEDQTVLRITCRKDHWPFTFADWGSHLVELERKDPLYSS